MFNLLFSFFFNFTIRIKCLKHLLFKCLLFSTWAFTNSFTCFTKLCFVIFIIYSCIFPLMTSYPFIALILTCALLIWCWNLFIFFFHEITWVKSSLHHQMLHHIILVILFFLLFQNISLRYLGSSYLSGLLLNLSDKIINRLMLDWQLIFIWQWM